MLFLAHFKTAVLLVLGHCNQSNHYFQALLKITRGTNLEISGPSSLLRTLEVKNMEENQNIKAEIMTASGILVDVLNIKVEDINIYDIATSLAHTCFAGGHVKKLYTNAQHSIYVSHYAGLDSSIDKLDRKTIWIEQMRGLLHDAAEAYTVDIRTPLKRLETFKGLVELEDKISDKIAERFGLDSLHSAAVKRADTYVRAQEMRDFMAKPKYELPPTDIRVTQKPFDYNIKAMDPKRAKEEFIKRFVYLQNNKP